VAKRLSRQELLAFARAGAEARIAKLQAEIDTIERSVGIGVRRRGRPAAATSRGAATAPSRRRRRMSAQARKKIADAAKRRWAKWRAEKKDK
jgi:hypothetical protein